MFDPDALSQPLSDDSPAGPNLEYDSEFLALESASRAKPEQQFGDTIVPAEAPDWKSVGIQSLALLERSRDLRVAALLVRSACYTEGVGGLARGLDLLARLTCDLWEHVHPQLDPDEGNDPFMRLSALSLLADGEGLQRGEGLMRDLRGAEIVAVRGIGACRMRDVELALGLLDGADQTPPFTQAHIEGMFSAAAKAGEPDHVGAALASLERLLGFLRTTVGSVETPDASLLLSRLKAVARLRAEALGETEATEDDGTELAPDASQTSEGGSWSDGQAPHHRSAGAWRQPPSGEIRHREDALRVLTKVCDYLERHEPTNPAPLLIRRAQRLMTLSFIDIMKDMAPESVDSITKIVGANQMPSADESY